MAKTMSAYKEKPDISIWGKSGHFYFALIVPSAGCQQGWRIAFTFASLRTLFAPGGENFFGFFLSDIHGSCFNMK